MGEGKGQNTIMHDTYTQSLNLGCYEKEVRIQPCPFVPKYYVLGFLLSLLFCYLSVALRKLLLKKYL